MFTAEEARKLAKEVKETKKQNMKQELEIVKQNSIKKAEEFIKCLLDEIKVAIKDEKDYVIKNVSSYNEFSYDEIIKTLKELKFNVSLKKYIQGKRELEINWKDEEALYIKTGKDEDYEKVISGFIKAFKQDQQYFEHKPVYWYQCEFPKQSFM